MLIKLINMVQNFFNMRPSDIIIVLNGVLQLTTFDGWVVEAEHDNIGWIFGYRHQEGTDIGDERKLRLDEDSQALYHMLSEVTRLYYETNSNGRINVQSPWIDKMIHCIARGGFFNTQRMTQQYKQEMWDPVIHGASV